MTWLQTASGIAFDLLNPTPEMVKIEDIAHHLARINRFTGATREPYSVAQHSVLMSRCIGFTEVIRLAALLHDAHEYVLGDWSTPLKEAAQCISLPSIRDRIDAAICVSVAGPFMAHVLLGAMHSLAIKETDLRMLATEKRDLLNPSEREWEWTKGVEPYDFKITPWGVEDSERVFLEVFRGLTAKEEAACL